MKKILCTLTSLSLIVLFASYEREVEINFYDSDYRNGLWISSDKGDTMDFVNNSNLIMKGDFSGYEEYIYQIEGGVLYMEIQDLSPKGSHSILMVEKNKVVLGNMWVTNGFVDKSRTFFKLD